MTSATKHLSGHGDLMLGYVATRDAERAQALRHWRTEAGSIAGAVRGLARTPLAGHLRAALGARQRQRAGAGRAAGGPRRRDRQCATRACPAIWGTRSHAARCAASARCRLRPRLSRARRALPRRVPAGHRGDQLRWRAHDRRAARALGWRRRARGLHPPVRRLRGHGRPGGGRGARARGRVTLLVTGASGYLGSELLRRTDAVGARLRRRATSATRTQSAALFERLRPRVVIHTAYRPDDRATTFDGAVNVAAARGGRPARAPVDRRGLRRREGRRRTWKMTSRHR